jgi:hypothetical protein
METDKIQESSTIWGELPPIADWQDTFDTVHMWSQIVGKIRLALAPPLNHSWGSTYYVTARGITTSPIPYTDGVFSIDFDFVDHTLRIARSDGGTCSFALMPMSVADFYHQTMAAVADLGITVKIYAKPVEVVESIPFEEDTIHASYNASAIHRFWHALVLSSRVFAEFRGRFIGKASPVHFFWGSFDLASTRFSGRTAPRHPGGVPNCPDSVMVESYSHELWSAGFWAGAGLGEAAFYAYGYPNPPGFNAHPVLPAEAYFHTGLGEFILPYEAVRSAENPEQELISFLQSTYEGAANLANWDRSALELNCPV